MRPPTGAARLALVALLCALGGCAKKSSEASAPRHPEGIAPAEDASIDAFERALADEERRLQAAGVDLRAPGGGLAGGGDMSPRTDSMGDAAAEEAAAQEPAPERKPGGREPQRDRRSCAAVCDLTASICDLEAQICSLASRHPGEPRYHQVCARAGDDCRAAREACDAC